MLLFHQNRYDIFFCMLDIPKILIIIEGSRTAGQSIMAGIAHYSHLHGPWIFLTEPPFYIQGKQKENLLKWIHISKPQGIILRDSDLVPGIEMFDIPIVVSQVLEDKPAEYPVIIGNDRAIGTMAATYFLDRGFRNFAFCGFKDLPWSKKRGDGFEQALAEKNKTVFRLETRYSRRQAMGGTENTALLKWIESLPKPIAVMTCNDDLGRQVLDACRITQTQVPEKMIVLGVDNEEIFCELSFPPLSSIVLNFKKAGYQAAEILSEMMAGKKPANQQIVIEPIRIITRQSTDSTAIEDPDVANALNYIRQNAIRPLQTQNVADAVCLSRRTLYDKFLKSLGHTVHSEIQAARVDAISKMLLETDFPISKIAASLGFPSDKHVARYFAKATGLSPRTYRSKNAPESG